MEKIEDNSFFSYGESLNFSQEKSLLLKVLSIFFQEFKTVGLKFIMKIFNILNQKILYSTVPSLKIY